MHFLFINPTDFSTLNVIFSVYSYLSRRSIYKDNKCADAREYTSMCVYVYARMCVWFQNNLKWIKILNEPG